MFKSVKYYSTTFLGNTWQWSKYGMPSVIASCPLMQYFPKWTTSHNECYSDDNCFYFRCSDCAIFGQKSKIFTWVGRPDRRKSAKDCSFLNLNGWAIHNQRNNSLRMNELSVKVTVTLIKPVCQLEGRSRLEKLRNWTSLRGTRKGNCSHLSFLHWKVKCPAQKHVEHRNKLTNLHNGGCRIIPSEDTFCHLKINHLWNLPFIGQDVHASEKNKNGQRQI